tara:strand:- start:1558 stop:2448 length:891 start_codon:yes stop_codon:yes gene_type:complete
MKRLLLFLIFISMSLGDQVDEMEELILNQPELIVYPEVLYKNGGLWFSAITDLPFTGRVEIYSDKKENIKILECTIVKGLKHGVFIQYFNQDTESSGIIGLYMDDKKEGGWIQTDPIEGWVKTSLPNSSLPQKITYISYRDGKRDGTVRISDLLNGQYYDGQKTGVWYFFNDNQNKKLWTVRYAYEADKLIDSECREHINGSIFTMDCSEYELKYPGIKNIFRQLDPGIKDELNQENLNRFIIKDINGMDVEIIVDDFLKHINHYHKRKISVHKERGYSFNINDSLRKLLIENLPN